MATRFKPVLHILAISFNLWGFVVLFLRRIYGFILEHFKENSINISNKS